MAPNFLSLRLEIRQNVYRNNIQEQLDYPDHYFRRVNEELESHGVHWSKKRDGRAKPPLQLLDGYNLVFVNH